MEHSEDTTISGPSANSSNISDIWDMESLDLFRCFQSISSLGNDSEPLSLQSLNCNLDQLHIASLMPTKGEFDVLRNKVFASVVILLYLVVILLGVVGNTLVVVTVAKTRKMWTATNVFIANLALADISVCVVDLPLSAYYQLTDDWIFGQFLCRVFPLLFAVVVYTSSLSLTMIAIDRYILVLHPTARRMTVSNALVLVVVIGVFAATIAAPIAMYSRYVVIDDALLNLHRRYCIEMWPNAHDRRIYSIATLILQFVLPLVLIVALYCRILGRLRERIKKSKSRKTKTTKMLIAVVTVFAIAWTPFHIFVIISEFDADVVKGKYFKFVDAIMRCFAMSSSCINPLLYGWMNDNYRIAFLGIIGRRPAPQARIRAEEDSESVMMVTPVTRRANQKRLSSSDTPVV